MASLADRIGTSLDRLKEARLELAAYEAETGRQERVLGGVTVRAEHGRVYWMSDWTRCFELSQSGLLRRVFHPGSGDPCAQYEEYFLV